MTAFTLPVGSGARSRSVPWQRMAWVTWRQHRIALAGVVALLAALAVYVWITGLHLHDFYAKVAACHPASSAACQNLLGGTEHIAVYSRAQQLAALLQVVPAVIGAFVGAPVLAREMETGTFRYAWTQGVGRWRWTVAKLVLLAVAVVAAAGAFGVLLSWYFGPIFATGDETPLLATMFDLRGVVLPAWALAAFALGALAGILIRRVVPAIAATLAGWAGLAVAAGSFLRQHYLAPLVANMPAAPNSAWVLGHRNTKGGKLVGQAEIDKVLEGDPIRPIGQHGLRRAVDEGQYLAQHGYQSWISYQPASRFWAFQWIESGWLLVLSALLIAAAVWLVRRRAA